MNNGKDELAALRREVAELRQRLNIQDGNGDRHIPAGSPGVDYDNVIGSFFEASVSPLVLLDRDFNYIRVNAAYADICRRDRSQFLERNHFDFCPLHYKDVFDRVVCTKKPQKVDARPLSFPEHPEWGVTYWNWNLTPLLDEYGEVEFLVVSFEDVTEKITNEEAGRRAAAEIEDLYNNAPCGYHSLDKDGVIVRINDTELELLGYSREEVVGKVKFADLLTEAGYRIYQENFPRFMERGHVRDLEFDVIRKDGSIISVLVSATAVTDAAGNYVMSRSSVFDVTEHSKADLALQESEKQFRTAFENASIGKTLTAPDGRLLKVNRAFCEMVGYSEEELTTLNFAAITHPEDLAISKESIRSLVAGERKIYQFEKRYLHKDGRIVHVSASTILLRDARGNPLYLISDFMDVSERWKADQKIKRLNRVYSVLININELIVRVKSVDLLYEKACRIAVEDGKLRMAWIGIVDETTGLVRPVASAGVVDGYLDRILVASLNTPHGRGPTGASIREDRYVVCNDFQNDSRMEPWRQDALERGYLSSAAIPLHKGSRVVGAFTIYAGEAEFFDDEEIRLLLSLADDISYAIEFIEQQDLQRRAEHEVRKRNQ